MGTTPIQAVQLQYGSNQVVGEDIDKESSELIQIKEGMAKNLDAKEINMQVVVTGVGCAFGDGA